MKIFTITGFALLLAGFAANAQQYRMIARSNSNYSTNTNDFVKLDTAHYDWAAGRGGYNFLSVYHHAVISDHMDSWKYVINGLEKDERINRTFDQNNNVLSFEYEYWVANGAYWKKGTKTLYTYDAQNHITEQIGMQGDANNTTYENKARWVCTYDGAGNQLTSLYQLWTNNAWVDKNKLTYTYNATNGMTSKIQINWDGNSWLNSHKYTYTLNSANLPTLEQHFDWNNGWKVDGQHNRTYDGNNNKTEDIFQTYSNNAWVNESKQTITYDNNNNDLVWTSQEWVNNAWKNWGRTVDAYDNNGNEISTNVQDWVNNAWKDDNKMVRDYNTDNLCTQYTRYYWDGNAFVLTNASERSNYYYEEYFPTSIAEQKLNADVRIFPVPASDVVNVSVNWKEQQSFTVSIWDMQGRVALQWSEAATTQYRRAIPVGHLAPGTYIVRINGEKGQTAQKITVAH